ncbi:hypothetical protein [Kribbella kalugense]|nr:hypothetical protein [Kribbella kalugense]
MELFIPVLATLLGGLASAVAGTLAARRGRHAGDPSQSVTLEARISRLQNQMRSSAELIEQITAEMEVRAATAASLKAEAEQAQQLASLHQEQQDAVMRAVRAEIGAEGKNAARQNLKANILFFLAGVLVSVAIQLVIKPL